MRPHLSIYRDIPPHERRAIELWDSTFYDFQSEWVHEMRRFAGHVKCRQIGASHSVGGGKTALHGLFAEDTTLVSIRDEEAKDLLDQVEKHCLLLADMGSRWARPKSRTAHILKLESGATILSTTSTAAGRGFTGNVVLDEFAYMPNQEATWDAALAATMHGFWARIVSTPNGAGDIWHQVCTELGEPNPTDPKKWKIFLTTVHDAIADGMDINLDECWEMARNDPRVFAQLFEGKFLDGNFQYFPSELIQAQTKPMASFQHWHTYGKECFGGIDIGETRDKTTLVIVKGDPTYLPVKHVEVHDRTDDELIRKLCSDAINVHGCSRVCIDKTGMGTFPAREARRTHGPQIEPVDFTPKSKEAMATRLYQSLVDGRIWLPREETRLLNDLMSIRRLVTEAGTVRYDAPRTAKGHADTAWALMLACQASNLAGVKSVYGEMRKAMRR